MSNLNLMAGDFATIDNPISWANLKGTPLVITGYKKCLDLDGKTWTYGYNLEHPNQIPNTYYQDYSQLSRFIQPIPLTPSILGKIEGMEKIHPMQYRFVHSMQYRFGKRLFIIRDGIVFDYASDLSLPHVHTLQQLIRLFCNKEIEI